MVRILMILTAAITVLSMLFKFRYKLLNAILGIRILKKIFVGIAMNIPMLRKKLLPTIFNQS